MADPTATADDEVIDQALADDATALDEDAAAPAAEGDGTGEAAADGEGEAASTEAAADDGEIVVTLGDEAASADADAFDDEDIGPVKGLTKEQLAAFVRMRQQKREAKRKQRELEARLAAAAPTQPQSVIVGEEPDVTKYDTFTDEGALQFKQDYAAWLGRKQAAEVQQRERQQAEQKQQQHWEQRLNEVTTAAKTLKVADLDDAQAAFEDTFSIVQQGIIIGAPDDAKTSALLRYALGKNPKKAKELAAIQDPVKFTFAIAKLESQLKVQPRKAAPPPETTVRTGGAGAQVVSQGRLKQLHEQAQKTGDYNAYFAAKRAMSAPRKAA